MNNPVLAKPWKTSEKMQLPNLNDTSDPPTLRKLNEFISKPNYKDPIAIPKSKINVFQLTKTKIVYNKPIYVGAQILDLSKTLMYQFQYQYMKSKFSDMRTLYTDTDSIIYLIGTEDFYKDISGDMHEWFDTSCYTISNGGLQLNVNKKVIGKFKDETGDEVISHFCANRPKSFAYKLNGLEHSHNALKGIVQSSIEKRISLRITQPVCLRIQGKKLSRQHLR